MQDREDFSKEAVCKLDPRNELARWGSPREERAWCPGGAISTHRPRLGVLAHAVQFSFMGTLGLVSSESLSYKSREEF